jgi:sigma-B regulation protein RsbU (phosphoserine phosphatase)
MEIGDVLVLYSDGISEAADTQGRLYSERRIAEKVDELAEEHAETICRALIQDVQDYARGSENSDDMTVVVVKRVH